MAKNKLLRLIIILSIPFALVLSQCLNAKKTGDPRGSAYTGSATCISCHKNIYSNYLHTAHFLSASPADSSSIQGSFANGKNEVAFNPHTEVKMEKHKDGFYQATYHDGQPGQSARFDITFGSVKGQTYAYWYTNELFQLPISYIGMWTNSPGYLSNEPYFERMISAQCLGCHMSFAKSQKGVVSFISRNPVGFSRDSIIYQIDCERCHGPAAQHVKFHLDNPDVKEAKYIATYKSLTREQKINMCAICHSGANNKMLKATFLFKPGDTLNKFTKILNSNLPDSYRTIDVHGNQTGLLQSSKCYLSSNLTCATCHDVHEKERDKTSLFTARCMTCHATNNQCKLTGQLSSAQLLNNCISCHMPAFRSKVIIAGQYAATVHTHHIGSYPEETQKVLELLKIKPAKNQIIH
jgi:hypothetical protein